MKQLPLEECGPFHKHQKAKPRDDSKGLKRSLPGSSELMKLQLSLKECAKIDRLKLDLKEYADSLNRYVEGKVPDKDVLKLLEGTRANVVRTNVINLYINRQEIENKKAKHKPQTSKNKQKPTHKHRRKR